MMLYEKITGTIRGEHYLPNNTFGRAEISNGVNR